jgi:hypothetical protein
MKVLMPPQSGSLGNQTASRNRSGQYLRQRSLPVQPRTANQVAARSRFTSLSAGWRGLTAAQRLAWRSFSNSFTVVNSLGQTINLTGHQCFVKVNCVNSLNGAAAVLTPPALPTFVACLVTGVDGTAGTQLLEITGAPPAANTIYQIYGSAGLSAGVSYNNSWKFIKHITSTDTFTSTKLDITTAYTAIFGALTAGKQIMIKIVQCQAGMQDNGTTFTCIVAT